MPAITHANPAQDLAAFLTGFTEELAFGDDDPDAVVARYYPPGFEQRSDGIVFDRARLAEHARPLRKNLEKVRFDVHEALVDGSRIAARYTLHGTMRKGRVVATEIYMFGELDADGRPLRIDQLTRAASS